MNRRGAQRGTLIRRGNTWAVRYRRLVVDANGSITYRQTTERVGSADDLTAKKARADADQIVSRANGSAAAPASLATFGQFVEVRFTPERVANMRPAGKIHYGYLFSKHINPVFGERRMCEITPGMVQTLLNAMSTKYSQQTVRHVRNAISAVFSYARLMGVHVGPLPTEDVECVGKAAKTMKALSGAQLQVLLNTLPAEHRTLVQFVATTGMRIGEALGLCWDAVNLEATPAVRLGTVLPPMSVYVYRAFTKGGYGPPKTAQSTRIVPLTLSLVEQLQTLKKDAGPVFRSSRGTPMDGHNVARRVLKPAGVAIGCPWLHWHALRHTAASILDLDITERRKVLGHASWEQTNHYTHPEVEKVRAAMENTGRKQVSRMVPLVALEYARSVADVVVAIITAMCEEVGVFDYSTSIRVQGDCLQIQLTERRGIALVKVA